MCDYGLENVVNRKAIKGEMLTLKEFLGHSRGFHEVGKPDCAVCLEPGTRLSVTVAKVTQTGSFWNRKRVVAEDTLSAIFFRPEREPHTRRDTLLFLEEGREVGIRKHSQWPLQELPVGTKARVLSPVEEKTMIGEDFVAGSPAAIIPESL